MLFRSFVEPFVGGGSVFMNVEAENYLLNDIDSWVVGIHQYLCGHNKNKDQFFDELFALVDREFNKQVQNYEMFL